MHADTIEAASWWARPRGAATETWIERYRHSTQARHRTLLVETIRAFSPETLLEVGAHCGPNLVRLCHALPGLRAIGLDVNSQAIEAGRRWMTFEGLADRVQMNAGRVPDSLIGLPDGCADVVLSCYTLAYVAPRDLDATLYELGRLARLAVVLAEPTTDQAESDDRRSLTGYNEWAHNFRARARWIGSWHGAAVRDAAIEPPVDRLNRITVITHATRPGNEP